MTEARQPEGTPAVPDVGAALLLSPVRRGIVEELSSAMPHERTTGLSAAELGERLDLHVTTVRFHVDQLLEARILDARFVRDGGVGRPSKRYVLREVPLGESTSTEEAPFVVLAGLLTSVLSAQEMDRLTPEEAGARWATERAASLRTGRPRDHDAGLTGEAGSTDAATSTREDQLGKVRDVTRLLTDWGYSPEISDEESGEVGITLRDCPFLTLAASHPDVVCGVHRGLLKGALDAVGEPGAKVSLRPFTGPTTCRALLQLAPPANSGPTNADVTSASSIEGDHR